MLEPLGNWGYDSLRRISICQRCGVGIHGEYIGTHDFFHDNLEGLTVE